MHYDVTIGIPVFNAEKYIRQTLDSALAQTFPNIEFLICDDCGSDSSMFIVKEYQQRHPRGKNIRIIHQPQNMGIGAARNHLIEETRGKYIYFMDADDVIEPNTIELLFNESQSNAAEIVYGSYDCIELFDDIEKRNPHQFTPIRFFNAGEFALWAYDSYDKLPVMVWNILIDIDVFKKNSLKFQSVNYWEDYVMTMDLPTYVTRVVLLSDVTYHYYCRYNSLSNFQKRSHIDKDEIQKTIDAMAKVKWNSDRIKSTPYFHKRMYKVMMTHFYIVCSILRNKKVIFPAFTNCEIRDVMRSPLSLYETLTLSGWKLKNLSLFVVGVLPPLFSVNLMKMIGKCKKLI